MARLDPQRRAMEKGTSTPCDNCLSSYTYNYDKIDKIIVDYTFGYYGPWNRKTFNTKLIVICQNRHIVKYLVSTMLVGINKMTHLTQKKSVLCVMYNLYNFFFS